MSLVANPFDLIAQAGALMAPTDDHPWRDDPVGWVESRCGEETWSGQRAILRSVRDNRFTAVRSAHSTGKSHIAARAGGWWIDQHPPDDVFLVTTAPSTNQINGILWRYLRGLHRKHGLPGYITGASTPEWKLGTQAAAQLVGWGRKPQDLNNAEEAATAFQGIHAKFVLVILDEAGGIPEWLWNAVDTLVTDPRNRVLAIGNPDDPQSHFEKVCRPASDWNRIKISAFDTPSWTGEGPRLLEEPHELDPPGEPLRKTPEDMDAWDEVLQALVSPEWVGERVKRWGEESPLYISKVLAEFPEYSEDQLIPMSWIRDAIALDLSGEAGISPHLNGQIGADIARTGQDETIAYLTRGGYTRKAFAKIGINDTMKAAGALAAIQDELGGSVPIVVDADGLGAGVFDRLAEQRRNVTAFHGGRKANRPLKFRNRRSEAYWGLRQLFEAGEVDIDPEDEDLQSQLASLKWDRESSGRIYVETKEDMKKRGVASPDRADALVYTFVPPTGWLEELTKDPSGLNKVPDKTEIERLLDEVW